MSTQTLKQRKVSGSEIRNATLPLNSTTAVFLYLSYCYNSYNISTIYICVHAHIYCVFVNKSGKHIVLLQIYICMYFAVREAFNEHGHSMALKQCVPRGIQMKRSAN